MKKSQYSKKGSCSFRNRSRGFLLIFSSLFIQSLTIFGDVFEFALPVGVGLDALRRGYTQEMFFLSLCAGVQQVLLYTLKSVITAPRPFPNQWQLDSFPSGHTAGAFLAVGFLFAFDYFSRQYAYKPYVSSSCKIVVTLAAALVGISRYLSLMHWPSDVIAGATLGIFFGGAAVVLSFLVKRHKLFC